MLDASSIGPVRLALGIAAAAVVFAVLAALVGRALIRRGLREPWVIRRINRLSDRAVEVVKRPLTIAVLDEVADVLRTGHYTRNVASAIEENRVEIKAMVAEKIKSDPTARRIGLLPFHDQLIETVTNTTLRVILEVLGDPRTDEFVSDVLRDNIEQIRAAVRQQSRAADDPVDKPDDGSDDETSARGSDL